MNTISKSIFSILSTETSLQTGVTFKWVRLGTEYQYVEIGRVKMVTGSRRERTYMGICVLSLPDFKNYQYLIRGLFLCVLVNLTSRLAELEIEGFLLSS